MAKPTNREIWQKGVSIKSAWLQFACIDDQTRYSELASPAKLKERASNANFETVGDVLKLMSAGFGDWTAQSQFGDELRESLLDELFNDQLAAYGYRIAPSPSREPVRIVAELFDEAEPNWKSGELSARGRTYSEIRIIDLSELQGLEQRRPGPKGSGAVIRAAITALQHKQINLCGVPRKEAIALIRLEIGGNHPKGSGLSDVNLAKYLLEICPKRGLKFE
ncbi:hypothetical protein EB810_14455 [Altererythrobacter sp. FM1]|uniref:hypothetical protein n=1 Tax=Tsuneonella flava TaxID=2055955 RepID=UPI000C808230|nr:hypothetical protein [Tsuneonella flava]ROT93297.1 hypothetical protein EB810_14455 [Altererythrobacter sp. FM1]